MFKTIIRGIIIIALSGCTPIQAPTVQNQVDSLPAIAHPSTPPTTTTEPAPTRAPPRLARVTTGYPTGYANQRLCPSITCHVIAPLPEGTPLLVAPGTDEKWMYVLSPQGIGWIFGQYVEGVSQP